MGGRYPEHLVSVPPPIRAIRVDEVMAAVTEAAKRAPGGALAFDGDGTFWSGDIGEDFFAALLAHGVRDVALEALAREAREASLDAEGDAVAIADRIHRAYLDGRFPEERVCEIMTWAAAGMSRAELDAFAGVVLERCGLRRRLHEEAVAVLTEARALGIPVYLVSASPRAIVEQAARVLDIPLDRTVSVREACDASGVVLCAVERPISYGAGKVLRLRERLGAAPLYAAFGDNAFDAAMLREAQIPVAIRPKARLLDCAGEVPGLRVLSRP